MRRLSLLFGVLGMVLMLSGCDTPWFKLEWAPVDISHPREHTPSQVLGADGSLIGTLQINRNEPVTREQIPDLMVAALTSAEDRRFFEHDGIDPRGIARAFLANQQEGKVVQGGSTITQQLVKNQYLDARDKTISRKAREANIALKLEEVKSKDEILTDYCNTVYLGSGAYGMQAGATTYFRKSLAELSLEEIALLVGLLRRPEGANPHTNPEGAKEERHRVLHALKDVGHIDEATFAQADATPLTITEPPKGSPHRYPRIVESVRRQIVDSGLLGWGEEDTMNRLFSNGYTITTTINPKMQDAAGRASTKYLSGRDPEAAIVLMDPTNGQVRALIGGRDFEANQFDLATQGRRQPGSVFKVIGLAAALEQGITLDRTFDAGPGEHTLANGETWTFKSAQPPGEMSLADGLVVSSNGVYARLGIEIGGEHVSAMATQLGVTAPQSTNPSNMLGGVDPGVTAYEMASVFATIANDGVRHEPVLITSIVDKYGNELITQSPPGQHVLSPKTAQELTGVMQRVVMEGTGKRAMIDRPVAGKTGTVNNNTDAWFVGYTPDLVGAVWVGYPDAVKPVNVKGFGPIQGGNLPAAIWAQAMREALEGVPARPFATPAQSPGLITPAPAAPDDSLDGTPSPAPLDPSQESSPPILPSQAPPPGQTGPAPVPSYSPYRPDPVLAPRLPGIEGGQPPVRPSRPLPSPPASSPIANPAQPVAPVPPPGQTQEQPPGVPGQANPAPRVPEQSGASSQPNQPPAQAPGQANGVNLPLEQPGT